MGILNCYRRGFTSNAAGSFLSGCLRLSLARKLGSYARFLSKNKKDRSGYSNQYNANCGEYRRISHLVSMQSPWAKPQAALIAPICRRVSWQIN
jgi:hypothetical protein